MQVDHSFSHSTCETKPSRFRWTKRKCWNLPVIIGCVPAVTKPEFTEFSIYVDYQLFSDRYRGVYVKTLSKLAKFGLKLTCVRKMLTFSHEKCCSNYGCEGGKKHNNSESLGKRYPGSHRWIVQLLQWKRRANVEAFTKLSLETQLSLFYLTHLKQQYTHNVHLLCFCFHFVFIFFLHIFNFPF